jgi:hypothetical protein
MNFFGHAAVAASHFSRAEPPFVEAELERACVGAMLPDFIGMLRLGRPELRDASLAHGVAFHHRTDEAFHELATFHELSRSSFAWLSERGLPRGPARAVAHIGVEILLDEVIANDDASRAAYRAALGTSLEGALWFPGSDASARLEMLRQNLLERARAYTTPSPQAVAARIRRSLAGRPRLELDDAGEALLGGWVPSARPAVHATAPALLAALQARLANSGRAD